MDLVKKVMKILETRNVFLTGGGGVGKSYLCEKIIKTYKNNKKQVAILGSTGISAVHIGGQTVHSFFAFGIANNFEQMQHNDKKLKRKIKELNAILQSCDLLIIDEISMISSQLLDMIKYRLQMGSFNGKILFVGDFFQLPPVNKTVSDGLFDGGIYAFESDAWEYFEPKNVLLSIPKRTCDEEFFGVLNEIRCGNLDDKILKYLEDLRKQTYVIEQNPTILFGRNKEADIMNIKRLYELENELVLLHADEKVHNSSLHPKKLESWKNALSVNECLELKVGANVLFCANKKGYYFNGERGVVVSISPDEIGVEKNGRYIGVKKHEFNFNQIDMQDGEIVEIPLASIEQFPLKLAYAITIHKSQGMSLENLVCNIDNIFEKSQFYVALSRAINPKQLYLHYSRADFANQIRRGVVVDERVKDFYENCDKIYIEESI